MLRFCHVMKGLEEVTISGDAICHTSVKDPIIGRLLLCGHSDPDDHVLMDWIRFYD